MLADSAYSACKYIVQSFKKVCGESSLHPQKEAFNTVLGQVRVKSEHCIGILKNRFAALKRISATIKGARSIRRVLQLFSCAAILHNMLLEAGELVPSEWLEMKQVEQQYKWTPDFTCDDDNVNDNNVNMDCRQQVFEALVEDNYI